MYKEDLGQTFVVAKGLWYTIRVVVGYPDGCTGAKC